jgi:catechol-2,3-dioxygenase
MSRFSTGFAEIVLVVEEVPKAAEFYREVVGLEPESEPSETWAWFFAGKRGEPQRIALHKGSLLFEEHSPHPEGERFGNIHFALLVPRDRLEAAVEHVRAHGIEVYGPEHFDWMDGVALAYYFYDLDGNLLEFWSPD